MLVRFCPTLAAASERLADACVGRCTDRCTVVAPGDGAVRATATGFLLLDVLRAAWATLLLRGVLPGPDKRVRRLEGAIFRSTAGEALVVGRVATLGKPDSACIFRSAAGEALAMGRELTRGDGACKRACTGGFVAEERLKLGIPLGFLALLIPRDARTELPRGGIPAVLGVLN